MTNKPGRSTNGEQRLFYSEAPRPYRRGISHFEGHFLPFIHRLTPVAFWYWGKHTTIPFIQYLSEVIARGFGLAISEITIFELLSGTSVKQEKEGFTTLSSFLRYNITERVLIASSQLATLYRRGKIPNQSISIQDLIIASTAVLTGSLVMTADINDFPRPFFYEAEEKLMFYRRKNKQHMIPICLLSPNILVINKRFEERPF